MPTLHIIMQPDDQLALETITRDAGSATILLLQDGVYAGIEAPRVFAGEADVHARGLDGPYQLVDDAAVVDLIVEHDRVICWH
jgi:sulfur relay protein TusB/DsrH